MRSCATVEVAVEREEVGEVEMQERVGIGCGLSDFAVGWWLCVVSAMQSTFPFLSDNVTNSQNLTWIKSKGKERHKRQRYQQNVCFCDATLRFCKRYTLKRLSFRVATRTVHSKRSK